MRMRDELTGEYVELSPEFVAELEKLRDPETEARLDAEMIEAMQHPERFKTAEEWITDFDAMIARRRGAEGGAAS